MIAANQQEVLQGTLSEQGELVLDHAPQLAAGRVTVILCRPPSIKSGGTLIDVLGEIEARQRARGYLGLSADDIERETAERQAEDDEYDERQELIWGQTASDSPPSES